MKLHPRSTHALSIIIPLAFALAVAGCSDDPARGTLTLHLTDAPFPFDHVASTEVVIDSVSVRVSGGAGFETIDRTQRTVDLLELRNGVTASLGSSDVPAGEIDQIRVYTGDATVTLTDDRSFPLKFPSGSSSGVKVIPDPPITVADGGEVEALIDFDLSQSFSAQPAAPARVEDIQGFHFHPVLRVMNLTDVGAVSGTVRSDAGTPGDPSDDVPLESATVVVTQAGADVTSTTTTATGRYVVLGLDPGNYTVAAMMPSGFSADSAAVTVEAARETAGVDLLLTPVP